MRWLLVGFGGSRGGGLDSGRGFRQEDRMTSFAVEKDCPRSEHVGMLDALETWPPWRRGRFPGRVDEWS